MATTFPRETSDPQLEVTLEVGTHVLELVVEDSAGNLSEPDTVTITVVGLPVVEQISPTHGVPGASVTITGRNFLDVQKVAFGEVEADFTVQSKTEISAAVPLDIPAADVKVKVVTLYGEAESPADFTVDQPMTIEQISPEGEVAGQSIPVVIRGTGLANASQVAFIAPGIVATVIGSTSTEVHLNVVISDQAAGRSLFTVTTPLGTVDSKDFDVFFTVGAIARIEPDSVIREAGTVIVAATIHGGGLAGTTEVEFSDPEITATVESGGTDTELPVSLEVAPAAMLGDAGFTVTTDIITIDSAQFGVFLAVTEGQPEMTIREIDPPSVPQNVEVPQAFIFGTGLDGASEVAFGSPEVTAQVMHSFSDQVSFSMSVGNAPLGPMPFQVVTPRGTVDSGAFGVFLRITEGQPEMTIREIDPPSAPQHSVFPHGVIFGTGLDGATEVIFDSPEITAQVVDSAYDQIAVELTIGAADIGLIPFKVVTPRGTIDSGQFEVFLAITEPQAEMWIRSIEPSEGRQNTDFPQAVIEGGGLEGATAVLFGDPEIAATVADSRDPERLFLKDLQIGNAQPGPIMFAVVTPLGTVNSKPFDAFFTVTRGPIIDPTGPRAPSRSVTEVSGIGPTSEGRLDAAGITSLEQLVAADPDLVAEVLGISPERATEFVAEAKRLMR